MKVDSQIRKYSFRRFSRSPERERGKAGKLKKKSGGDDERASSSTSMGALFKLEGTSGPYLYSSTAWRGVAARLSRVPLRWVGST